MERPGGKSGETERGGDLGRQSGQSYKRGATSNHICPKVLKCRWLCLWSTQGSGGEGVPVWAGEDRGTEVLDFAHTRCGEVLVGGIWNLKCNKLYIRSFLHVQIRS